MLLLLLLVLPAVLRCWAGPGVSNSSSSSSHTSSIGGVSESQDAIDVALDITMMLVKHIYFHADMHGDILSENFSMPTPMAPEVITSQHVQWLLSFHVAMTAQSLYKQQRGRSKAVPLAAGSSKRQQQQIDQQGKEQLKVAAVHKRLLEGLGVPGLVGVEYEGQLHMPDWANATVYPVIMACYVCNCPDVRDASSSSGGSRAEQQQQQQQQLWTPTLHLRRAAVLLELCLLDCRIAPLQFGLQCVRREVVSLRDCLQRELSGDTVAAAARAQAAVAAGLLPALLQQLPAAMECAAQLAESNVGLGTPGNVEAKCSMAVREMGVLLADVLSGEHSSLHARLFMSSASWVLCVTARTT
jgi:hypothetical protein